MHIGKELEAHLVEKRRLSCDSNAPQVGSARSDSTSVVKVNRRKTNCWKTRPYCLSVTARKVVSNLPNFVEFMVNYAVHERNFHLHSVDACALRLDSLLRSKVAGK